MTKKIALIIGVAVLLFTGCTSEGHKDKVEVGGERVRRRKYDN